MADTYILDLPLPPTLDFTAMKSTALAQIKQIAGYTWTNFNESDPGVTILDQLCYALTELGYCTQFPIADVLTASDGKIRYQDQFFAPQDILTSSPITLDDYRRYIHDQVSDVGAIYLCAETINGSTASAPGPVPVPSGRYQSYLYLKPGLSETQITSVTTRVYKLLNQQRNLAEVFLPPEFLQTLPLSINGTIYLSTSANANQVYSQIQQALNEYCAPLLNQAGFQQLLDSGYSADQIFNGPRLQNGWIDTAQALPPKRDSVHLLELSRLISAIPGILCVENLAFSPSDVTQLISASSSAIGLAAIEFALGAAQIAVGAASIAARAMQEPGNTADGPLPPQNSTAAPDITNSPSITATPKVTASTSTFPNTSAAVGVFPDSTIAPDVETTPTPMPTPTPEPTTTQDPNNTAPSPSPTVTSTNSSKPPTPTATATATATATTTSDAPGSGSVAENDTKLNVTHAESNLDLVQNIALLAANIAMTAQVLASNAETIAVLANSLPLASGNAQANVTQISSSVQQLMTSASQLGIELGNLVALDSALTYLPSGANWMLTGIAQFNTACQQMAQAADTLSSANTIFPVAKTQMVQLSLAADFTLLRNMVVQQVASQSNAQAAAAQLTALRASHAAASVAAKVDVAPPLPSGTYREIEQYYSIQNTFPDVYQLGCNALHDDAPPYQVAQNRQFKAYLTIYDQLLANQFSQLAHVAELFSFGATDHGQHEKFPLISARQQARHNRKHKELRFLHHLPQEKLATTYYCQALYEVPGIKALLRGHEAFHYQFDSDEEKKVLERDAWKAFQRDPYNQYMYGLRESMETQANALQRRDHMLSHLLARHGEHASDYDEMLSYSARYGDKLKTRIIVKSIWLQNYQELSYHRTRAYDCLAAQHLGTPGRYCLSLQDLANFERDKPFSPWLASLHKMTEIGYAQLPQLSAHLSTVLQNAGASAQQISELKNSLRITDRNMQLPHTGVSPDIPKQNQVAESPPSSNDGPIAPTPALPWWQRYSWPPMQDGEIDQAQLFAHAKMQPQDFRNFSCFELKLSMFLGLQQHYLNLAANLLAFINDLEFAGWLNSSGATSTPGAITIGASYQLPDSDLVMIRGANADQLMQGGQQLMEIVRGTGKLADVYQSHVDQLLWLACQRKGFLLVEHILLSGAIDIRSAAANKFFLTASLLFPNYVGLIAQAEFDKTLQTLLRLHWPAHVGVTYQLCSYSRLKIIIPYFAQWHNLLPEMMPELTQGNPPSKPANPPKGTDFRALASTAATHLIKLLGLTNVGG